MAFVFSAAFALACATPAADRSEPSRPTHTSATIEREGVVYRELEASDFAAATLPRHLAARNTHTAAYLCGAIAGPANLDVEIVELAGRWSARVLAPAYRAYLNPRCSWLDPELDREAKRYAVEHEQVHFALLEIEARQLNRAIRALEIELDSPEAAASRAQEEVDRLREVARARYLEHSRRFDAEASHPSKQHELDRWREITRSHLAALPRED